MSKTAVLKTVKPKTVKKTEQKAPESTILAGSFDIGKKNFAFCLEEFNEDELRALDPIEDGYNPDGTPTEEMEELLRKINENGKLIFHSNTDLTENCDTSVSLDPESFHNMTILLDKYKDYWERCSLIVIERQMAFGKKVNLMAIKLAQHCYSYFCINYGRKIRLVEFDSFHKTQVLGAPKVEGKPYKNGRIRYVSMTQAARKKWSIEKCIEILMSRGEMEAVEQIIGKKVKGQKKKKLDDICDCLCQLSAAKYILYIKKE